MDWLQISHHGRVAVEFGGKFILRTETLVGFSPVHINMLLPGCLLDSILSNTNHKV